MWLVLATVALALGIGPTSAEKRKASPEQIGNAIKARMQSDPNWLKNFTPDAEVMIQAVPQGGTGAAIQSTASGPRAVLQAAPKPSPKALPPYSYPPTMNIPTPALGFNAYVNYGPPLYAYSPPIQKFSDTLPGLGKANASSTPSNLALSTGAYIPVAAADKTVYKTASGSSADDYYALTENEYTQVLHSGMPPTILRGYAQVLGGAGTGGTTDATVGNVNQYLGPAIIARSYNPSLASGAALPNVTINGKSYGPYVNGAPVRLKVTNSLPTYLTQVPPPDPSVAPLGGNPTYMSNWFLPTDVTLMGSGPVPGATAMLMELYTNNRTAVHLHGGFTPWISDGTPFQWFTPAGQTTSAPRGVSFHNAPDMITGAACKGGAACISDLATSGMEGFYYTNQQSSRLMFYHDHAQGITRLNVFAGMAGPYLLVDQYEEALIDSGIVPNQAGIDKTPGAATTGPTAGGLYRYGIPLVIQDKTFVNLGKAYGPSAVSFPPPITKVGTPSASILPVTTAYRANDLTSNLDPGWTSVVSVPYPAYPALNTKGGALSATGEGWFWYPHEYQPNESIYSQTGVNGTTCWGRWDFGPFMSPPLSPLYENLPSPTIVPEAYMDTMVVNGAPFPTITLPPAAIRFRILSVPNERVVNLQWYFASDRYGNICRADTTGVIHATVASTDPNAPLVGAVIPTSACTEVKMVPTINPPVAPCASGTNLGGGNMAIAAPYITNVNTSCSAKGAPLACCTGAGAGTCTNNSTCIAAGSPSACCTGLGAGSCNAPGSTELAYFKTAGAPLNGTGLPGISLAGVGAACMPSTWPTDGREGGIPDPVGVGPAWVQIGNEGGLMPYPAIIPAQPINFDYNRRDVTLLDTTGHALMMAPAERADVVTDFGTVPRGSVLILFNDNPAPTPTIDPRTDLYTDAVDYTGTDALPSTGNNQGGAVPTPPGWGPNIRTIMQVIVDPTKTNPAPASTWSAINLGTSANYATAPLNKALPQVFGMSQPKPVAGHSIYNQPFTTAANPTPYPIDLHVMNPDHVLNTTGGYAQFDHIQMIASGTAYSLAATPPPAGAAAPTVLLMSNGGGCATNAICTAAGIPAACCTGAGAGTCTDLSAMNATQTNYTVGYNGLGGVTLTSNGAGCTSPPTVTFGAPATGTTAVGVATVSGGIVTGVVMTNFGSGYTGTVAPTVTFTNPAGGGCTTLPVATATLGTSGVGTVTFTNAANGTNLYCASAPYVYILNGGGTGASAAVMLKGSTVLESIGITEGFDPEYGRMYVIMGTAPTPLLPTAPSAVATQIPGYHDPPTDIWYPGVNKAWRVTHLGVDSHGVHFHLGNFQLVNRVDYTNTNMAPDLNEFGWKEVFRTYPFTDMILASKINMMWLPFQIPRSSRLLDPTMPANVSLSGPTPVAGGIVAAGVNNTTTDYGWEYVFHCHYLDHEENDMMRPMVFDVSVPPAPTISGNVYTAAIPPTTAGALVVVSWVGSPNASGFTLQRSTSSTFPTGPSTVGWVFNTNATTSYNDITVAANTTYYYRVMAVSPAGNSAWSNTATVNTNLPPTNFNGTVTTGSPTDTINFTWTIPASLTGITGYTIAQSTSPTMAGWTGYTVTGATTATYNLTGVPKGKTYYFVIESNTTRNGPWSSPVISIAAP
jgi:FtsP/CotA-like multicopper oxidase with cupredoxin domain